MSNNAHDLSNRLLNALDNNYNVVDMHAVNEIISILEKFNITKELLETTRLGKHVNELRRKTSDPTLARRAKVLVKRWRDLVIPTVASPGNTGSNRSSAERQVRRLGGHTPLTSPALTRVVSPAVPSPRPASRPAWGGYESDSQDVIVVDDDPPPLPLVTPYPHPPPKRPLSPETHDDKKAKRDKKPKKRRGHSRAGSVAEGPAPPEAWGSRNGSHEPRRNGCRRDPDDPYQAMVNRIPPVGAKKVKTTQELLEQIQSRGAKPEPEPSPPNSPDVQLIEDTPVPVKPASPLRNGTSPPPPRAPLEDPRPHHECTCGLEPDSLCPAARSLVVTPLHVQALHHTFLPGVNGTRAPPHPHQFAVRKVTDPEKPGLFNSVVPLYNYSDYADDYCVKNMSRVPLCTHIPWTEFAPPPPDLPPPKTPPPLLPYPIDDLPDVEVKSEPEDSQDEVFEDTSEVKVFSVPKVEVEMVGVPTLEPSERLKAPLLSNEEETQFGKDKEAVKEEKMEVECDFISEPQEHRTVEKTKESIDGRTLYAMCQSALESVPYNYMQVSSAPLLTLPEEPELTSALMDVLDASEAATERDSLQRPLRPDNFTEWHECAQLGDLIALPYVVID